MKFIYLVLREKLRKQYGVQKVIEMETYFLKNFSLAKREEILYVHDGNIQVVYEEQYSLIDDLMNGHIEYKIKVSAGSFYITSHHIIAQGRLKFYGVAYDNNIMLDKLINASILPCYGYAFPINKLFNLRHSKTHIRYSIIQNSVNLCDYTLTLTPSKTQESIDNLVFLLQNNKRDTFYGEQFCFTGFTLFKLGGILPSSHAKHLVKALGGKINDTGSKNLSYLITSKPKAKYVKLQERGTKILTDREFLDLLEG